MTEQHFNDQQIDTQMKEKFWQKVSQKVNVDANPKPSPIIAKIGGELELFLFDTNGQLATDDQKRIVLENSTAGVELGAAAAEIHPDPINLPQDGFAGLLKQLKNEQNILVAAAKSQNLFVGRNGTIPWVPLTSVDRTQEEKYQQVPDFHNRHRQRPLPLTLGPVTFPGAEAVGILNSFQFSVQANSADDSLDKLNRLMAISPLVVALSANSNIFEGQKSSWADSRMKVWHMTHDTRSQTEINAGQTVRVGLPNDYYHSMQEYMMDVASHPAILDKPNFAFEVLNGIFWRDARIKFIGDQHVVEFRPISTQPTIEEDIALASFTVGRLLWSQMEDETLLPMTLVRKNKTSAEKFGMHGFLQTGEFIAQPTGKVLWENIQIAREGLRRTDLLDDTAENGLRLLEQRVQREQTPSDLLAGMTHRQLIEAVKIQNGHYRFF